MYIFTKVLFGHRISRNLADQSRHVQQHVLQFAYFESYGPAVHGELGRRFDSSCHGLQKKTIRCNFRFLFAEILAELGKWTDRVCRKDGVRTSVASLAAPN